MDHASSFVYVHSDDDSDSGCESFSEEELDVGLLDTVRRLSSPRTARDKHSGRRVHPTFSTCWGRFWVDLLA